MQARTSHYISVDAIHDELSTPNPFADALIFYRGGINGNEAPIRVIQGPKTMLVAPDNVAVDGVHNEVFTASFPTDSILVYNRTGNGDVAPIRILHGPNTQLDRPIRVDIDPVNNIIGVVTDHALMFFNRTDQGDVAPKWVISGDNVGAGTRFGTRDVKLYPEGKKIIANSRLPGAGGNRGGGRGRGGEGGGGGGDGEAFGGANSRIGVWQYGDNGDVAPWAALNNTPVTKLSGSRLALDPADGDLIVGGNGQIRVYHLPEIFAK